MKFSSSTIAVIAFWVSLAILGPALAEDVVYLKDGSIIHGTITEETPGKKIKIETKDGNVFVYKMKQIDKITHSKPKASAADNAADSDETNGAEETSSTVVKPAAKVEPSDPHAHFNKFGFLLNAGIWAPDTVKQLNANLEAGTGSSSYDYLPGWFKVGMGIGWFTNNIGLKWNFQFTVEPNNYQTDWYYGGYYAGTTEQDTSVMFFGSELEADLSLDSVVNKNNVTSVYLPLIGGIWAVDWNYSDSGGNTLDFSNTTTDFGTGIGVRGFDSSNFLWDIQCVYRWSSRGNYLQDSSGYQLPSVNGKYIDANVSGLDLNFTIGFLFQ